MQAQHFIQPLKALFILQLQLLRFVLLRLILLCYSIHWTCAFQIFYILFCYQVAHVDTKHNSEILSQLEPWTVYCIQVQAVIPEWNKTGELSGELCEQTTHNGNTWCITMGHVLQGSRKCAKPFKMKINVMCKPSENWCVCYLSIVWWLIHAQLWSRGDGNKVKTTSSRSPMACCFTLLQRPENWSQMEHRLFSDHTVCLNVFYH